MTVDHCHYCKAPFDAASADEVVTCSGCGRLIVGRLSRRINAARRLRETVRADADLEPALRDETLKVIRARLHVLCAEARDLVPRERERLVPPPLPDTRPAPPEEPPAAEVGHEPVRPVEKPAGPPLEPRAPSLWSRLGPVFAENLLFVLAAFLLVAGAVYFVSTAWTTMTGAQRLLVLVGGLELLGIVLFAAGRLLNRGGELPEVERVLLIVVTFLMPLAAAAAAEVLFDSAPLGVAALAVVLPSGWFAVRAVCRDTDAALAPFVPTAAAILSAPVIAAPWVGRVPVGAATLLAVAFTVSIRLACRRVLPLLTAPLRSVAWGGLLLGFATCVGGATFALAASRSGATAGEIVAPLGVVCAGIGVAMIVLESSLGRSTGLLVAALSLAVTGFVMSLGTETAVLAATTGAAIVGVMFGVRLDRPRLMIPGLAASAVAYLYLPAPVRATAEFLRDRASESLGYTGESLPLSFYGVGWLPYVAAGALIALWLARRERKAFAGVLLLWTASIAVGLALLSFVAGDDLRAPTAVLVTQGALLAVVGRIGRDPRLVLAGALGVFAGAACGAAHLEASPGVSTLALCVVAGLCLIPAATHRRSTEEKPPSRETNALTDAAALMAVVLVVVAVCSSLPDWLTGRGRAAAEWPEAFGYLALAGLLSILGAAYRRVEGGLLAVLALVPAAECALAAMGPGFSGPVRPLTLVLVSAVPILLFIRPVGMPLLRPGLSLPRLRRGLTSESVVAVQALLVLGALRALAMEDVGAATALGMFVGGALVLISALMTGRTWAAWVAAIQIGVSGPLVAGAIGLDVYACPGADGLGLTALLVGLGGAAAHRKKGAYGLVAGAFITVSAVLSMLLLVWLLQERLDGIRASEAWWLLAASLFGSATGLHARRHWGAESRDPLALGAGLGGGLLLGLAAVGLLDALSAWPELYPLAFVAAAATALLLDVRTRPIVMFVHLAMGLGVAIGTYAPGTGGAWLLLAAYVLVTAGGWVLIRDWPFGGGLVFLLGAVGAVSPGLAHGVLNMRAHWQPALVVAMTALVFAAPHAPWLRIKRAAAVTVGSPFAGVAALALGMWALHVATDGPGGGDRGPLDRYPWWPPVTALAFVTLGSALSTWARGFLRAVWPCLALGLAVFLFPPVNRLIHWTYADWWRPDIEMAITAGLFALILAPKGARAIRPAALEGAVKVPYIVALLALVLTAFEIRDITTPLTFTLAAATPFVLLLRDRSAWHADVLAAVLLLAAYAFTVYAVPDSDQPEAEILPLLAFVSLLMSIGFLAVAGRLRARAEDGLAADAAHRLGRAAIIVLLIALALLASNVLALSGREAPWAVVVFGALAAVGVGGTAWLMAGRLRRPALLHLSVIAFLVLHAFLVNRSGRLGGLDGYHLHLLAAVGASLLVIGPRSDDRIRRPLTIDGLLLPVPVVLASLAGLVGATDLAHRDAVGFFMAAAVYGVAALRLGRPAFGWLSLALVDLALFSIWRRADIVNPTFYGVPAGLSLILGGEVARRSGERTRGGWLLLTGLVILYGSAAVQVLRVEHPVHALVLFGLGLVSVLVGVVRVRNEFLLAGTAAVVLDVIAYFAQHGFERSFVGAGLLLGAGLTVLAGGAIAAGRRRRAAVSDEDA